ncbi:MAG: haloacid dehalogenase-like hydrolase [Candidatus Sulfobium sp.]|jgi:phosphoglycolate phosphatase
MAILKIVKFILFDIDGTLIDSGGAGSRSLDLAFRKKFGIDHAFRGIEMAGKTDLQIVREALLLHGIDFSDGTMPAFFETYTGFLKDCVHNADGHIKPGIEKVLGGLASQEGLVLGLLTGNIEEGARIKLERYGLYSYFRGGAFGSDSEDRNELLPLAVAKLYRESGVSVSYSDCVVIGDTPRDIFCARPYGALAVGVATGPYSVETLSAAGADAVFGDLSDTRTLISLITGTGCGKPGAQGLTAATQSSQSCS